MHHSSKQKFVITFNQLVLYVSNNAANVMSSGTNMLILEYNYHHNNNSENIGLGNIYVEYDSGLNILRFSNSEEGTFFQCHLRVYIQLMYIDFLIFGVW